MNKIKLNKTTIGHNPYVGLFTSSNDKVTLAPSILEHKERKILEDTLGTEVILTRVQNSYFIGVFIEGNNNSFILAKSAEDKETVKLREAGVKIHSLDVKDNALGNLVACNDYGAYASHLLTAHKKEIAQGLGLEEDRIHTGQIAGLDIVGSAILATNNGFIAHPKITDKEFEELEGLFKVKGGTTTANYGDPLVSNSITANSHGVVVGERTSSPEILRVSENLIG